MPRFLWFCVPSQLKCIALVGGWYAERRLYQEVFVVVLILGCGLFLLSFPVYLSGLLRRIMPAVLGSALVILFVTLRAASFHHEEESLGFPLPTTGQADMLLELPGICLVAINGALLVLKKRKPQH